MKMIFLVIVMYLFSMNSIAQEVDPVVLERTDIKRLHSEINGKDYELLISLPLGYNDDDTSHYPLIIQTDAYRSFSMIKGITDLFTIPGTIMRRVIIVGIGYGGKGQDALLNWVLGRTHDLTPVNEDQVNRNMQNNIANAITLYETSRAIYTKDKESLKSKLPKKRSKKRNCSSADEYIQVYDRILEF